MRVAASVVEVRPDLAVVAATIAIVYELPIRAADDIVRLIAAQTLGYEVVLPETPARAALLAPYRQPRVEP